MTRGAARGDVTVLAILLLAETQTLFFVFVLCYALHLKSFKPGIPVLLILHSCIGFACHADETLNLGRSSGGSGF